jgi:hypothetical protein
MTVIDKILNEWSFRCHDGIVDINDPIKVSILNEILTQYNLDEQEKSIVDKIKDIISNLRDEEKEQVTFDEVIKGCLPDEDENNEKGNNEMYISHSVIFLLEVDVRPVEEERRCKGTAQQEQ